MGSAVPSSEENNRQRRTMFFSAYGEPVTAAILTRWNTGAGPATGHTPKVHVLPEHARARMLGPLCTKRMKTADVVIIGGGIVGASLAYPLTAAGCRSVLVVERESAQGKGSTGKSMGGVRAQFSTPVNIQMSMYSIPFYASFEERLGYPRDS